MADMFRKIGLGGLLEGLRARKAAFTGLASSDTQVHPYAATILSVENVEGTPLAMVTGGSADASEVSVEYDADGVPTFVFAAAVTAYTVNECCLIGSLADDLEEDAQAGV
jgi:hypothetical protein